MRKEEKAFRKALKETYIEYYDIRHSKNATEDMKDRAFHTLFVYEEVAKKVFPNINVELCENRWWSECRKVELNER